MHEYWDKQPTTRMYTSNETTGLLASKPKILPPEFIWSSCKNNEALTFLQQHYLGNSFFKLYYTPEILKWSIDNSVAIRKLTTRELVGYITTTDVDVRIDDKVMKMAQINYLCVHESYRNYGFAPILIDEIKRRIALKNIWQAVYTAHINIPTPISKSCYWHRFLDVKHLIKTKFHQASHTRERYHEVHGPCKYTWKKMTNQDIPKVIRILQEYNEKFKITPVINEEFVKKRLLPIHSYISDETDGFISFYDIPCERADGSDVVKQVYRYFMVGDVYNDAFLIAKNLGYHVFNSAEAGVSTELLEKMKFVKGTGYVYYYLFNWNLNEPIKPEEINLILP